MLVPGLVSVTFRALRPGDVIRWVAEAGLQSIEWGGDVHVPPGDLRTAEAVARQTREAGLEVACYGSYLRLGTRDAGADSPSFPDVLDTARALGAPWIRVWAGTRGSAEATPEDWMAVAEDARHCADLAAAAGIGLVIEYHGNSLTDSPASAVRLLDQIGHPRVRALWQPTKGLSDAETQAELEALLPWLVNLHLFSWGRGGYSDRLPLDGREALWEKAIQTVRATGRDHHLLLEFVAGDRPERFLKDAAALRRWLA